MADNQNSLTAGRAAPSSFIEISIVSHIDIVLISVWRKPGEKENFDKLLFAEENRCRTMIFATNTMLINILVSYVGH